MVVNLACPKCGGQATEYDDKKWSCLRCGNKFVYAPAQPSHTFVQSNVHIQGQATFELDAKNAKHPIPKLAKMVEHNPDFFGQRIAENKRNVGEIERRISSLNSKHTIALIASVLMGGFWVMAGLATLMSLSDKKSDTDFGGAIAGLVLWGLIMIWPVAAWVIYRKNISQDVSLILQLEKTISALEAQNLAETKVGDCVICPHCENALDYIPLNSPPPTEGLKHCLKCGKQFFTAGLTSYPILLNK